MAGMTINLIKSATVSSISKQFCSSLVLTSSKPFSIIASFGTSSSAKSPELQLPKKPLSVYFQFRQKQYPLAKAANPTAKPSELASVIAQKWGTLADEDKQVYQEQYAKDKAAYDVQMNAINAHPVLNEQLKQLKEEKSKERANKAFKKAKRQQKTLMEELGRPKPKALSGYTLFYKDEFAAAKAKAGGHVTNIATALGEAWKALTPEQQAPYIAKYKALNEEYQAELEAWKAKMHENTENSESIADAEKKLKAKRRLKKLRA